jgi:hypothetical protein
MRDEFPELAYMHAAPSFEGKPKQALLIPRDRHPNAAAHRILADLLAPAVEKVLRVAARSSEAPEGSVSAVREKAHTAAIPP